jgi:AraC-like DNA-binding protein
MAERGIVFKPTDADRKFVVDAVMAGIVFEEIAGCLKISINTLKKHFRYELLVSQKQLCGKAARCLSDAIDSGSVDAAKFVLARKMGWAENLDVSAKGNFTIVVNKQIVE